MELLRSCGYEAELMDTGCCGMAGTFGYEAEHYDLSMKIGELRVFPKVREIANSQASIVNRNLEIVSTGAACRLQIEQGTGVKAIHPIVLVAQAVKEWRSNGK